jgi:hypothetical protein
MRTMSRSAKRRWRKRQAELHRLAKTNPTAHDARRDALVESWRRELWRRARDLHAPPVWALVERIRRTCGEADGAMAAAEAVRALNSVMAAKTTTPEKPR